MNTLYLSCIISLLCATFLPFQILAQTVKPSPIGEIPFTLDSDNRIYVTAFANISSSSGWRTLNNQQHGQHGRHERNGRH